MFELKSLENHKINVEENLQSIAGNNETFCIDICGYWKFSCFIFNFEWKFLYRKRNFKLIWKRDKDKIKMSYDVDGYKNYFCATFKWI